MKAPASIGNTKAERFNKMQAARKLKREDLMVKRRGLNFVNDTVAESLSDESVLRIE